ncbi:MAG: DcrB-related protein [Syntrophomonadaceae bacterium]
MRKPVVKGIIFLAILMLLANVMACSSSTPTNESKPAATSDSKSASTTPAKDEIKPVQANIDATKDWQSYDNATYNLKMKYPKDWTKKEESGIIVGFMSGSTANVNLVSEDLSKSPSMKVDEYLKLSLPNIEKEFQNFKLLETTPVTLGNVKGQKIVYTASMEGMNLKFMQVLTIINQKAFVLTYTALADDYDKNLETANNIFGSLSI